MDSYHDGITITNKGCSQSGYNHNANQIFMNNARQEADWLNAQQWDIPRGNGKIGPLSEIVHERRIKNFLREKKSLLPFAVDLGDTRKSIQTLNDLEFHIRHNHGFRKYQVRPLERKNGKGCVDDYLNHYRGKLQRHLLDEERAIMMAVKEAERQAKLQAAKTKQEALQTKKIIDDIDKIVNEAEQRNAFVEKNIGYDNVREEAVEGWHKAYVKAMPQEEGKVVCQKSSETLARENSTFGGSTTATAVT